MPYRPSRRTRVYDSNYDMGEKYYKPTLDKLNGKYSRASVEPMPSRILTDNNKNLRSSCGRALPDDDMDLKFLEGRKRFIHSQLDDDLTDNLHLPVRRPLGDRLKQLALLDDIGLDSHNENIANFGIKSNFRSRMAKLEDDDLFDQIPHARSNQSHKLIATSIMSKKVHAVNNDSVQVNSAASARARATKARLADLDSEISQRSEKIDQREKRAAGFRKILADTDIKLAEKHVSF